MAGSKDILLGKLRTGAEMSGREQFKLTLLLAFPSIMAQLSMCLMSYIDAAMVGRLGSAEAAAIGLVSTSTWILGSFCYANSSGFSVQIAHRCGARDFRGASGIFRQGMLTVLMVSLALALLGISLSGSCPPTSSRYSARALWWPAATPRYPASPASACACLTWASTTCSYSNWAWASPEPR